MHASRLNGNLLCYNVLLFEIRPITEWNRRKHTTLSLLRENQAVFPYFDVWWFQIFIKILQQIVLGEKRTTPIFFPLGFLVAKLWLLTYFTEAAWEAKIWKKWNFSATLFETEGNVTPTGMEPNRNNAVVHRKVIQKQFCCCCNVTRLPENQSPWPFASHFIKFSMPHINSYKR